MATPSDATRASVDRLLGHEVLMHGLASRPDLNGQCGRAQSFDNDKGRYVVKRLYTHSGESTTPLLIKPDNLLRCPDPAQETAQCCAAEHAEEVRQRVDAARSGALHESGRPVLDLEETGLNRLPGSLAALGATVRELWLASNKLSNGADLDALRGLRGLRVLDVDANRLSELPEALGSLSLLESLYANTNQLTALPVCIGSLRALKELRVSHNQLSVANAFPDSVSELSALRSVWLASNGLAAVPPPLCRLRSLEELDLTANRLVTLPPALGRLPKLHTLELGDNPLESPPREIVDAGSADVKRWLVERCALDRHRQLAAKVVEYAHEPEGSMHLPVSELQEVAGGGEFVVDEATIAQWTGASS